MRLNRFIAESTQFSRRKADQLIQAGKVFVNGKLVTDFSTQVDPLKDKLTIKNDNSTIQRVATSKKIYLALNKPQGYITTRKDERNRKTVMDLIPKDQSLKPVGRLDKDSEGLLLFSNDGNFINHHTHPKFESEKEYSVEVEGKITDSEKRKLEKGIIIDEKITSPAKVYIVNRSEASTTVRIIIHEGRNRQIRKMFDSLGHPVKYLQRIRIGKILLGSLKIGEYRILSSSEL